MIEKSKMIPNTLIQVIKIKPKFPTAILKTAGNYFCLFGENHTIRSCPDGVLLAVGDILEVLEKPRRLKDISAYNIKVRNVVTGFEGYVYWGELRTICNMKEIK